MQLEDIIKYGLDWLFQSDESSSENNDFTAILGPTMGGEWQQAGSTISKTLVNVFMCLLSKKLFICGTIYCIIMLVCYQRRASRFSFEQTQNVAIHTV